VHIIFSSRVSAFVSLQASERPFFFYYLTCGPSPLQAPLRSFVGSLSFIARPGVFFKRLCGFRGLEHVFDSEGGQNSFPWRHCLRAVVRTGVVFTQFSSFFAPRNRHGAFSPSFPVSSCFMERPGRQGSHAFPFATDCGEHLQGVYFFSLSLLVSQIS